MRSTRPCSVRGGSDQGQALLVAPSGPLTSLPVHGSSQKSPKAAFRKQACRVSRSGMARGASADHRPAFGHVAEDAASVRQDERCAQSLPRHRKSAARRASGRSAKRWDYKAQAETRAASSKRPRKVAQGKARGSGPAAGNVRPRCSAAPRPTSSRCAAGTPLPELPMSCAKSRAGRACRRAKSCPPPCHRGRAQGDVRQGPPRRLRDRALRHARGAPRPSEGPAEPGWKAPTPPKGTTEAEGAGARRRVSHGLGNRNAETRRRLGGLVGLQHGGRAGENAEACRDSRERSSRGCEGVTGFALGGDSDVAVKLTTKAFAELKADLQSAAPKPSAALCAS